MNTPQLRVLLVDDDEDEYFLLRDLVRDPRSEPSQVRLVLEWVSTYQEAVEAFRQRRHDAYLVDYRLGAYNGLNLLGEAAAMNVSAPIIILTGQGSYDVDLMAMEQGAADYLIKKQLTLPLLERSLRYATEQAMARSELRRRAEEMQALNTAIASLLTTLNLEELLSRILDAVELALPAAERSYLHLPVINTGQLELNSTGAFSDQRIRRSHFSGARGHLTQVFRDRQPIAVDDVQASGADLAADLPEYPGIRSLIAVPLLLRQQVVGVLTLVSSRAGAFPPVNRGLLVTFATTAAAAIENANLHAQVRRMATTDALTGALNRRAFEENGQREMERFHRFKHPLTAFMFDLDNFKQVNDTYGHPAGDRVLQAVAQRCRDHLRRIDLLGRYGGDEFSVLLPETDLETAREAADRILRHVTGQPIAAGEADLPVSISLGIAAAGPDTPDLAALMAKADAALYLAKQRGRNRFEMAGR